MKICAACCAELPRKCFSKKQWQLKKYRRCKECIDAGNSAAASTSTHRQQQQDSADDEGFNYDAEATAMEGYDYEAAASTVMIEEITASWTNQHYMLRIKENDPTVDKLSVVCIAGGYCPESALDLGWMGYYIGKNTKLKELNFSSNPFHGFSTNDVKPFF